MVPAGLGCTCFTVLQKEAEEVFDWTDNESRGRMRSGGLEDKEMDWRG